MGGLLKRGGLTASYDQRQKRQKKCVRCGADYYDKQSGLAQKYCSAPCAGAAQRERAQASWPPKDEVARLVQIECLTDVELGARYGRSYQWAFKVRRHYGIAGWPVEKKKHQRLGIPVRRIHTQGYVVVSGEYEHRVVAEKKLGRKLLPEEVVHHIDGDKSNNRPENLQVFATRSEHMRTAHPAPPRKPYDPEDRYDTRKWGCKAKGEDICRVCHQPAVHLHHAIPRSVCRTTKQDLRNGLPLCRSCHTRWHLKTLTIYRDAFTEEEWMFLSSVVLTGQRIEAWLDDHYPQRKPVT